MTIDEAKANIGNKVEYQPYRYCSKSLYEYGIIISVSRMLVFVRYGNDTYPKATSPQDLTLA